MKRTIFKIVISLFLVIFTIQANAQQNFIVSLKIPPPGTLNTSDFYNVTVTNNSGSEQSGYLSGTAKEENNGMIVKGTTIPMLFKKGVNNIKIKDLPKTPDVEYLSSDPRYKEALVRTGKFLPGTYEICVKLLSAITNEELGSDCINQEVLETGLLTLINPEDETEIDSKSPVTFTWSSGGKVPEGGYTLSIVELKDDQSPESAMKSNKAFFEQSGLRSSTFTYPNSGKGFVEGKTYAWFIKTGNTASGINTFRAAVPNNYTVDLTQLTCTSTPGKYNFIITITVSAGHGYNPVKVMNTGDIAILSSTPVAGLTFTFSPSTFPVNIPRPGTGTISGSFQTTGNVALTQIQLQVFQRHFFSSTGSVIKSDDLNKTIVNNCIPLPTVCQTCPTGTLGINLVQNPNFDGGNTLFTSSTTYDLPGGAVLVPNRYTITTSAVNEIPWAFCSTHPGGTGRFLACDGANGGTTVVWRQIISVTPNTNYIFCALLDNLVCPPLNFNDPTVKLRINNVFLNSPSATITLDEAAPWTPASGIWNSAGSTTATIEIVMPNSVSNGWDIGVDNISFSACTIQPVLPTVCETCPTGTLGINLVQNPNFDGGNTLFTSSTTYDLPGGAVLVPNRYTITTSAVNEIPWAFCSTHPGGTGRFLACDGANGGTTVVWRQIISVTPNTNYIFCALLDNLVCPPLNFNDPTVKLRINNVFLNSPSATITLDEAAPWTPASGIWNSAGSTTATIEIVMPNSVSNGWDIGVDNISFSACTTIPVGCTCGSWNQVTLQQGSGINVTLPVVNRQVVFNQTLSSTLPITLTPVYNCNPISCTASYDWYSYYTNLSSSISPITFDFNAPGNFRMFRITPRCGTNGCDTVNVKVYRQ